METIAKKIEKQKLAERAKQISLDILREAQNDAIENKCDDIDSLVTLLGAYVATMSAKMEVLEERLKVLEEPQNLHLL